jgi:hypothetical protein
MPNIVIFSHNTGIFKTIARHPAGIDQTRDFD